MDRSGSTRLVRGSATTSESDCEECLIVRLSKPNTVVICLCKSSDGCETIFVSLVETKKETE